MDIKNNILKKELKNLYIIGGNACAGKSTMAKMLAEKYGFTLYQMDMHYDEHRSVADEKNQPNMCYPTDDIEGNIPKERAVFLTSNKELVIRDYFNRPEKRDFYECVKSFPNADRSFENVFNTVDLVNRREIEIIKNSCYFSIARDSNRKIEDTLKIVETHFGLV